MPNMTDIREDGARRTADRRKQQIAIDFADRRQGERRSGTDRRAQDRVRP